MDAIRQIVASRIFLATLAAWATAQGLKVLIYYIRFHKMNFRLFVGSGGMPSSHSSFVTCLAVSIGRAAGWASPVFMLSLGIAFVIMSDAAGVRRAAGTQAHILNEMMEDYYRNKPFKPKRLKELLGHTPLQVVAGASLGLVYALIFP